MDDQRASAEQAVGRALSRFLEGAHRIAPDALVDLIATCAADLGSVHTEVWLADHEQRALVLVDADDPADPMPIEGTSAGRAFITSEPVVKADPGTGSDRAWLPLLDGVDRIGVLGVVAPDLDDAHLWAFRQLASVATAEIITRGQYSDRFTSLRRRRDMTVAAEVQWAALPPSSFTTRDVSVAGMLEPAYDVSGDTFDYTHSSGQLDVAVLDAVGHDLGSTLICTLALGAYRNTRRSGGDLRDAATHMDRILHDQLGAGAFATGQIGALDTDAGIFRWLNAGHPLPLLIRDDHVGTLPCRPRLPFGLGHIDPVRSWEVAEHQLQPGDGILLYTDGIIEARSPGGEEFGEGRLREFLHTAAAGGLAPHETLRRLSHAVVDFHAGVLRDDATTLYLVWQPGQH